MGRGWCSMHYYRWRTHGSLAEPPRKVTPVAERFWAKVDKDGATPAGSPHLGPCWLWTAYAFGGYGRFIAAPGTVPVLAYRWSWEAANGPIPDGLTLDHLCRVPRCVNPAHLEPVTMGVNVLRGGSPSALHARKTHCVRGHPFTEENTIMYRGWRRCRACRDMHNAERYD